MKKPIPKNCYINFDDNELDLPIYRVTTIERVVGMFCSKEITLTTPRLWDDPFENPLLKANCKMNDGEEVSMAGVMKWFYGQCWTLERESDAMWRIYAPRKNGVIIKTTIRRLLTEIYDHTDPSADRKFFIGKVIYGDEKEIENVFNREDIMTMVTDRTFRSQALTLLLKRKAFVHEKEVRIIYRSGNKDDEDIKKFKIEPNELFNEITFDPRMEINLYSCHSDLLRSLGYTGLLNRSRLYDPPNININIKLS